MAALPVVLALVLLVALRWPAMRAMPVCAGVTATAAFSLWQVPLNRLVAAVIEASWVTASILLIVFGALFFLALLRATGAIAVLQRSVGTLSADLRIQAVLVGWTVGSFLEGAAGFGTPAAIAAPLLIGLGFRPLQAVVIALVGDSTAVSFGAVGTPIVIGMGRGLEGGESEALTPTLDAIAQRIAAYDLILGTLMPVVLVMTVALLIAGHRGWRLGLQAAPFAFGVGLAQATTSWIVVLFLGPEFPSLLGPLAGFLAALLMIRSGWLVPREVWRVLPEDGPQMVPAECSPAGELAPFRAFAPYLLLLVLLVLSRLRALPIGSWLSSVRIGMSDIRGTEISAQIEPLYSPGAVFILCALLSALWLRTDWKTLGGAARSAGGTTLKTAVALLAAIITVRIFIHSDGNQAGFPAMPIVLASSFASGLGGVWPAIAPWVGALGSFVSGSATFSNLLFALLQLHIAVDQQHSPASILALQSIGAAAGNMVCIHNVLAACAVAGILGEEGNVIRRTALPMVIYLLIAGCLGSLL